MNSGSQSHAVSVIMPVKNGEKFLDQALESVLQQTLKPAEIIVVIGPSTDNTWNIAAAYSQVRLIQQETGSLAEARNLGLANSQGDIITFLDHDDIWMANKLDLQLKVLKRNPNIQYCISYLTFIHDGQTKGIPIRKGILPGVTPGALMARRELFDQVGLFNPDYSIGSDHEWFSRARDAAVPMSLIPQVLLKKRLHGGNLSADLKTYQREMVKIVRKSIARKNEKQKTVNE